jgi:hypothetical protein
MTDVPTHDHERDEPRYMTGFFDAGTKQDVLAIWDDDGHGVDVWYDPDTGDIGQITDWAKGQGLLSHGAELAEVTAAAKKAIEKCRTFERKQDQGGP